MIGDRIEVNIAGGLHIALPRMVNVRQKFDAQIVRDDPLEQLTMEQVRRAINVWLQTAAPRLSKTERLEKELAKQQYYQRRAAQARRSHTKTRKARLKALGIDADRIKSCVSPPD